MQTSRISEPPRAVTGPPLVDVENVDTCDVCGSSDHQPCASGYDYELETCSNLWWYVRCDDCGHVWLHPRPAVAELSRIYPPHYYAYDYDRQVGAIARWGKATLDHLKVGGILKGLPRPPHSYLDVGCGNGRFLKVMEGKGVPRGSLYGLELDPTVVERLVAEGYRVVCERVESCTIAPGSIDLITIFHVIEHVAAPGRVIQRLAQWLTPGGVLALETPNIDSWDAHLFHDHFWGGYHIPRHWHLFRLETLTRLLRSAGLEVKTVRYQPGHAFWLYSLHHRLKYGPHPRPGLARWFDPFNSLVPLVAATGFDVARAQLGFKTSAMLVLAAKPDPQVR